MHHMYEVEAMINITNEPNKYIFKVNVLTIFTIILDIHS